MGIALGWEKRVFRTNITYAKRTVRICSVSPQSRSLFSASLQTFCLIACSRLWRKETGESGGGRACNHFFYKRPVPLYHLLVYPLIGQIWPITLKAGRSCHSEPRMACSVHARARNRGIHNTFCVERMFTRFPAHGSADEGTEYLPCELGAWKRCFCNPADRLRSCLITKWQ